MTRSLQTLLLSPLAMLALLVVGAPATVAEEAPAVAEASGEVDADWTAVGLKKFRKSQRRPIQLGTSGGNAEDFEIDGEFITCVGGTLGALMEMQGADGVEQFVLSNNHVLAQANKAKRGDDVIQPALLDSQCVSGATDVIGELSDFKRIRFSGSNKVDMSIASVAPGSVRSDGRILKLGIPGNGTVEAVVGMKVKKVGRTSGQTKGKVTSLGTDVNVDFSSGSSAQAVTRTARFVDQIVIRGNGGKPFVEGGDSGSVVYENVKKCPRAVGLVFAGSGTLAAANPIDEVLKQAAKLRPKGEKSLVGCSSSPIPAAGLELAWPLAPQAASPTVGRVLERERLEIRLADRTKRRYREQLFEEAGVVGVGVALEGPADQRRAVLHVLVERADPETLSRIPTELEGRAVRVIESGRFRAF